MLFDTSEAAAGGPEFLDVAVLAGGNSAERDVSLASGRAVAAALTARGHHVTRFDPAEVDLDSINWRELDVCFIALHGGAGENGQIQLQLEEIGIPYTGSSPVAARLAMSKSGAKDRFLQYDIATPAWQMIRATAPITTIIRNLAAIGFPAVIKPDNQGSSLGVSVAWTPDDVAEAVETSSQYQSFLIAERLIAGRELTVAVLDGRALPVLEITHDRAVFDYSTKRAPATGSVVPLEDGDPLAQRAASLAVEASEALGTRGLVRVDLMVDENNQPWVLEVNAVPGMTDQSLAPLAAREMGCDMPRLCDFMLRSAMALEVAR